MAQIGRKEKPNLRMPRALILLLHVMMRLIALAEHMTKTALEAVVHVAVMTN